MECADSILPKQYTAWQVSERYISFSLETQYATVSSEHLSANMLHQSPQAGAEGYQIIRTGLSCLTAHASLQQ